MTIFGGFVGSAERAVTGALNAKSTAATRQVYRMIGHSQLECGLLNGIKMQLFDIHNRALLVADEPHSLANAPHRLIVGTAPIGRAAEAQGIVGLAMAERVQRG